MKSVAHSQHRIAERFAVPMPVVFQNQEGAVHDLSSTGVLFESSIAPAVGEWVDLTLQYLNDGQSLSLQCRGEVVRVEAAGDNYNIAVRLSEELFPDAIRLDRPESPQV